MPRLICSLKKIVHSQNAIIFGKKKRQSNPNRHKLYKKRIQTNPQTRFQRNYKLGDKTETNDRNIRPPKM